MPFLPRRTIYGKAGPRGGKVRVNTPGSLIIIIRQPFFQPATAVPLQQSLADGQKVSYMKTADRTMPRHALWLGTVPRERSTRVSHTVSVRRSSSTDQFELGMEMAKVRCFWFLFLILFLNFFGGTLRFKKIGPGGEHFEEPIFSGK